MYQCKNRNGKKAQELIKKIEKQENKEKRPGRFSSLS